LNEFARSGTIIATALSSEAVGALGVNVASASAIAVAS
jgi:hypothetical protein